MNYKPLIGLNADYRPAQNNTPAYTLLAAGYYDRIMAAGGIPIVLPPLGEEDEICRVLDVVQGVMTIGGGDLDPRRDGYMLHPATRAIARQRESFDRMLMRIECHQLPVDFTRTSG